MTAESGSQDWTGARPLKDFLQYQDGAVISRTLVKKPGGTVTVFAFDAGEGLSEHTAPFDALVLLAEGEADISIAGRPHRLAEGDLLLLPANQPHGVRALTRMKMLLVMIKA